MSIKDEVHTRYKAGERDFSGLNLSNVDLSGLNLQNADLAESDLNGANLSFASLEGACLHRATLRGTDLACCRIGNADFTEGDLRDISEMGDGDGVNFSRVNFQGS